MRCRNDVAATSFSFSESSGTFGGGGGGGAPRSCSRTQRPRFTGEVRVGLDVTVSTLAWVEERVSLTQRWIQGHDFSARIDAVDGARVRLYFPSKLLSPTLFGVPLRLSHSSRIHLEVVMSPLRCV